MNPESYLARIGIDPPDVETLDAKTLGRLQRAHITTIPFETLSITGDPYGSYDGEDVSLAVPDLYEKIVTRNRGGFCYELNGLFGWLLADLGFDVRRVSARIKSDDGFGPPADHLTLLVDLNERYLVDVGLGVPKLRRPLPLAGSPHVDAADINWRIVDSERPDADFAVEYRSPNKTEWDTRCIFRDVPRPMDYFQATCEYFEQAPDSHFTGSPIVAIATQRGHSKLSPTTITRSVRAEVTEESVDRTDWYTLLTEEFGLVFPPEHATDGSSTSQSASR